MFLMLKHQALKEYAEVKIQIHASLTSVLNRGVCSNSRSDHLDHLSDTRLSHKFSLDTVTKRQYPTIALVNCWIRNAVVCSLLLTTLTELSLFGNSLLLTNAVNMMSGAPDFSHGILTSGCHIM
jgi:hypothetical protein